MTDSDHRRHYAEQDTYGARRSYLKIAKQRKAKLKATRHAIGEQLTYVGKNLETLSRLKEEVGENKLNSADMERLETIEKVYEQQRFMHETGTHSCPDRIVSLRQPHVRCIVRGKAGRPYEFGQKLHLSVVNGLAGPNIEKEKQNEKTIPTSAGHGPGLQPGRRLRREHSTRARFPTRRPQRQDTR